MAVHTPKPWHERSFEDTYRGRIDLDTAYKAHFVPKQGQKPKTFAELAEKYQVSEPTMRQTLRRMHQERMEAAEFQAQQWYKLAGQLKILVTELEKRISTPEGLAKMSTKEILEAQKAVQQAKFDFEKHAISDESQNDNDIAEAAQMQEDALNRLKDITLNDKSILA